MRFSIVALFAFLFGSCQPSTDGMSVVPSDEFAQFITKAGVQLLDVRTPSEFEEGHIEGAIMIDYRTDPDGFLQKAEAQLQKDRPVALYCRGGRRSHSAAEILFKAGFKQLVELEGGILAWQEAGKPLK
ncbi:MAG: rhodanese-like domain-containing protein [Bacteroidaceae bacterium]|nr:rhodanese-like domain-containing protein [Bacteroidaceae bacterium]